MAEVLELRKRDREICRTMEMESFHISATNIPTPEQFNGLKKHLDDMIVSGLKRKKK